MYGCRTPLELKPACCIARRLGYANVLMEPEQRLYHKENM